MREELGIAAEDSPHIRDLFHQSIAVEVFVGYPACPNLEDQTKLFALLKPEENVGVRLTSGFLLEPSRVPRRLWCTIRGLSICGVTRSGSPHGFITAVHPVHGSNTSTLVRATSRVLRVTRVRL